MAYNMEQRFERLENTDRLIAEQLAGVAKTLALIEQRMELHRVQDEEVHARVEANIAKLDAAVAGTDGRPGLDTRVDRIETAILFLRWIFGGGLVAAATVIGMIWKVMGKLPEQ